MNNNILNRILIEWNDSDIEDSGLIKASDIKNGMKYQLVYTLDKPGQIKIFDKHWFNYYKFRDKVYINDKYIELNDDCFTVNEYKPGEYYVYIDRFDELNEFNWRAFYCCFNLTSITIPNSVTSIGDQAFKSCTGLKSITIPDSVTEIGDSAFEGCSSLTSVTIPNSVKKINGWVFSDCINLTSVTIPNSVTSIGAGAFYGCTGLTSVTIPDSVTIIDNEAFCDCTGLTSITIPNSMLWIGKYAFENCKELKTVYIKDIEKFKEIEFGNEYSDPTYYGAKLIELKNEVFK